MADEFMRGYLGDLLHSIRTQVALKIVTPYTRLKIASVANVRAARFALMRVP
jgi:hypothetical protein